MPWKEKMQILSASFQRFVSAGLQLLSEEKMQILSARPGYSNGYSPLSRVFRAHHLSLLFLTVFYFATFFLVS